MYPQSFTPSTTVPLNLDKLTFCDYIMINLFHDKNNINNSISYVKDAFNVEL